MVTADTRNKNESLAIVSLSRWIEKTGIHPNTALRWRRKGWLKTVNICGRQYLTQAAIDDFTRRAQSGEFAKEHKVPKPRKG